MAEKRPFIDIHSHIIFGADDGAQSLKEAVELLKLDREEGAVAVCATPHYGRENLYTPDAALVMQNFERLKERAAAYDGRLLLSEEPAREEPAGSEVW